MLVQKKTLNAETNQFIGVNRGGKITKIHAVIDGSGNSVRFMLTGGHVHDSKSAVDILSGIDISGSNILANKAYGTLEIRNYITKQHAKYTITLKSNTIELCDCDFTLYNEHHLV